ILFFISFFVQFVDPEYAHPVLSFVALARGHSCSAWCTCRC
ncbi:leucine export protein LeuE, partial [Streptomyces sparsogenes DSM 40356]